MAQEAFAEVGPCEGHIEKQNGQCFSSVIRCNYISIFHCFSDMSTCLWIRSYNTL